MPRNLAASDRSPRGSVSWLIASSSRAIRPADGGGGVPSAAGFDELAYRQLIEGYPGRERPITRVGGVPHSFGDQAAPLIPPGSSPMKLGYLAWVLTPELQAQYRSEHRMVAVPPVPDRPDECVRPR